MPIAYTHEWYMRNRARLLAAVTRCNKSHRAQRTAYMRKWRAKNKAHYQAWCRAYRAKKRKTLYAINQRWRKSPKGVAWRKQWKVKRPDLYRASIFRAELRRKLRKMSDAAYYARRRAQMRSCRARATILSGGVYRPIFSLRLPDWAVMGQRVIDGRSQFLAINLTPAQRAYARELYRERHPQYTH